MNAYLLQTGLAVFVLLAVVYYLAPVFNAGLYFGYTVDPQFPQSQEGRALLARYRRRQLVLAVLMIGGWVAIGVTAGRELCWILPMAAILYVILGSTLWVGSYRRAKLHAVQAPLVRTASLSLHRTVEVVHLAALVPLVVTGIILILSWDRIPERFPIHWNASGVVNGWAVRSPLAVFWPLMLFAVLVLGIWVVLRFTASGNRQARWILPVVAWGLAIIGSFAALLPLRSQPGHLPVAMFLFGPLLLIAITLTVALSARRGNVPSQQTVLGDGTPDSQWFGGILYYNPKDAALWVPKRFGVGWTLNFARPASWIMLAALLALPLLVLALANFARR